MSLNDYLWFLNFKVMLTPVRNIVFDLGGVLIDYDLQRCLDSFRKLGFTQIDHYVNPYTQSGFFAQIENGTVTPAQWYAMIDREVGHHIDPQRIDEALCSFLIDIPDYKLDMLRDLRRQGYRVCMLSNTNVIMFEWMKQHVFNKQGLTVLDYFDRLFLSYEMKMVKPNEEIFRKMLADEEMVPTETLLIDDGEANVAAASALGIHSYLAHRAEDFRSLFHQYPPMK